MSFWGDVHRRCRGQELRKEDEVKQFDVCMDYASLYPRLILSDKDLKSAQIELKHMSEELTKEINRLRWDLRRMKKQLKCNDRV
jgi:hypothetical protein